MVSKELKVAVGAAVKAEVGDEPVSPTGQYFNSSVMSVCILALFESDVPIDDSPTMDTLKSLFLPINPRFSSVMVTDKQGIKQWKRVELKLEDHVNVPVFPSNQESYEEYVRDYISKIAVEELPQDRPLWDLHIIKYPTRNAAGTMVFKLHHALGDGFSLMAALFSCIRRADDPSLPLTFPTSSARPVLEQGWRTVPRALSVCINTLREFGWSLLKSSVLEDDRTPVRSGTAGVEFRPIEISSVAFSLDDVRKIKSKLGGTVNDVITGIIFYGTQLYVQAASKGNTGSPKVTALVLLNTRNINNYQTLQEMTNPSSNSPWGNQFGFMHVAIPMCNDFDLVDPLDIVSKAREIIQAKKNSLAVYLTGRLLELIRKFKGPEVTAQYLHATLKNTSMTLSNLTGPIEQMGIAGHPIRSFYFMVVGVPQSLTITAVSYMGKLKVAFGTERGFIDSHLLISCMHKSFERIFNAAMSKKNN